MEFVRPQLLSILIIYSIYQPYTMRLLIYCLWHYVLDNVCGLVVTRIRTWGRMRLSVGTN